METNLTFIAEHILDYELGFAFLGWTVVPVSGNIAMLVSDEDAAILVKAMQDARRVQHEIYLDEQLLLDRESADLPLNPRDEQRSLFLSVLACKSNLC